MTAPEYRLTHFIKIIASINSSLYRLLIRDYVASPTPTVIAGLVGCVLYLHTPRELVVLDTLCAVKIIFS